MTIRQQHDNYVAEGLVKATGVGQIKPPPDSTDDHAQSCRVCGGGGYIFVPEQSVAADCPACNVPDRMTEEERGVHDQH
ncbi:MAG: hypothetical protein WC505_05940 [Patescibacteria group bacterium]